MSSYRASSYVPWSSTRGSTYASDKPSLSSSVGGSSSSSRYGGSSYRSGTGSSSLPTGASNYRSSSATRTNPTDTNNNGSAVSSIREKYAGRTTTTSTQDPDKSISRKYGPSSYSPPEPPKSTPTLRFGSTSRFGGQIARSPISEKSPTIFGVSTDQSSNDQKAQTNEKEIADKMTVITRGTSPTPPSNSTYLRTRRADMERTTQRQVQRAINKPPSSDSESQTDEKGITSRREVRKEENEKETHSRTTTPWTSRFSPSPYTPSTTSSSRYSPRSSSSSYSYSRPTDLPLRSTTLSKTPEKENSTKTTPISPKDGRDPTRIGGFSYARPTDLPNLTSLNKVNSTEAVDKTLVKQTASPMTPEKKVPLVGLAKETTTNDKLLTPDRSKLPPPVPKSDSSKSVANKDFRKSVLNMDFSTNEDLKNTPPNNEVSKKNSLSQSKSLSRLSAGQKLPVAKLRQLVVSKTAPSSSSSEESSSSESTETSSSDSSDDDEDDEDDDATNAQVTSISKDLSSSKDKIESKIPISPSRGQMTSGDEASISMDKPPRPPSSMRSRVKTEEEAKAVVCRVLSTNQMKKLSTNSSSDDLSDKGTNKGDLQRTPSSKSLQRNLSSKDLQRNLSNKSLPRTLSNKDLQRNLSNKDLHRNLSNKDLPRSPSNKNVINNAPPIVQNEQYLTVPDINDNTQNYKITKIESGEKAWWLQSSNDIPNVVKEKSPTGDSLAKSESKSDIRKDAKPGYRIRKIESGERAWWMGSSTDVPGIEKSRSKSNLPRSGTKSDCRIKRTESGDRGSWQQDSGSENTSSGIEPVAKGSLSNDLNSNKEQHSEVITNGVCHGSERQLPEFKIRRIESGSLEWWLDSDEERQRNEERRKAIREKPFIGRHTNIDDVLGSQAPPPIAFRTPRNTSSEDSDSEEEYFINADQVRIHDSSAKRAVTISRPGMIKLDDTALQLYKDGDYGSYLDLEASINEQQEEFEDFNTNRKNSIVLRTQLSVRVHTIKEKLLNSEGRELRRALFSLKQIFQEDKDLVHEFVQNDGLNCLIKVGSDAEQNYQNYILRALGQVMLYVDGMNGVMEHQGTIQWLYSLVSSKFRLVVKTALKLLLVFVEYVDTNSVLLVKAIRAVDYVHSTKPWSNIMKLLKDYDSPDAELLIYATSLINKTLNGLPDQDSYYDQVDALEEQGFESVIRRFMSKQGTDLDLLRQFQIYEAVLHHEDGEDNKGTPLRQLDETVRKTLKNRKCLTATLPHVERRKSRRHSTGTSPAALTLNLSRLNSLADQQEQPNEDGLNDHDNAGVTPALRRRRERAERQRSFIREQREASLRASVSSTDQSSGEDGSAVRTNGVSNGDPGSPVLCNGDASSPLRRDNTVKDLSQKLASTLNSPDGVNNMKGIISKAKEGLALAKSQSRGDVLKSPTSESPPILKPPEIKKSETELHWEELLATTTRELCLCDLDFTDLASDEDLDVLAPACRTNGIPPPPPPIGGPPPAPVPAILNLGPPPGPTPPRLTSPIRKSKKTVKLFWKEVREDPLVITKMNARSLIWDELSPVSVDTQKLEHLFESRAKDLITKKQQELNKNKEVIVLDPKRSNAINIGMTKLPPPRAIKTAILKMDATVVNREGIEKLLTMLPSEEERSKIQEAQVTNPELPLGSAEQFLLMLASISELAARLKLWAFKLDYENCEKEIAEPLMDLKQGMETLKSNKTFKAILGTLLSIGIFLNGNEVKGFQIEYLSKVPEVKDTVHKHSLLHHLCHTVMEKFPDSTDLYSEIGAVTRASKVDFDELSANITKMEQECKASFDHLKVIVKHDGSTSKNKMSDFLADCAERIIVLAKVHRRVINRYHKFCLWLGIPLHRVSSNKPNELCRIISEFALEYRTTRERVLQQLEKKASHRERNKTRGKMITEVGKFRSHEDRADAELRQLLGKNHSHKDNSLTGSLPWRRTKKDIGSADGLSREEINGNLTDADDELLESLVKTATKAPTSRTTPRERKRTRHADRKSLRRTLRNGLSDEERKHLAAYIKGY